MPTITTTCKGCQKEFTTYRSPSYLERHPNLYCSRACFDVNWATAKLFVCEECGIEFSARYTTVRRNPRFCSRACRNKNIDAMVDYVCQECGKTFRLQQSLKRKYCSRSCSGKHSYVVGRNPKPIYGKCKQCGTQLTKVQHEDGTQFCQKKCYYSFRLGMRLEEYVAAIERTLDDPHYPGNYRGPNWPKQRGNARRRDGYRCQRCGIEEKDMGHQLDVHHIQPFHTFGIANYKAANVVSNLISLCRVCHQFIERNRLTIEQLSL